VAGTEAEAMRSQGAGKWDQEPGQAGGSFD